MGFQRSLIELIFLTRGMFMDFASDSETKRFGRRFAKVPREA